MSRSRHKKPIIWREQFIWNGHIFKTLDFFCYCNCCGLRVVHFNKWSPETNLCMKCYLKSVGSINAAKDEIVRWSERGIRKFLTLS